MRGKPVDASWVDDEKRITPADAGKTQYHQLFYHRLPDHPRGCGENSALHELQERAAGSPPRMRGKQHPYPRHERHGRITPADAGKTSGKSLCKTVAPDHPRGCGENRYLTNNGGFPAGSPPRMRGKRKMDGRSGAEETDHPRGCGENYLSLIRSICPLGSPPRMRGKRIQQTQRKWAYRITPADAGKTLSALRTLNLCPDHPRGCGENWILVIGMHSGSGSPPRMRGKRHAEDFAVRQPRITPADAGKTNQAAAHETDWADHPRGCGENLYKILYGFFCAGSPPRMRGKLHKETIWAAAQRITPADAGKTAISMRGIIPAPDHPRGCGENGLRRKAERRGAGSPPRMRGKLIPSIISLFLLRITPAGAGKTSINTSSIQIFKDHPRRCGENQAACPAVLRIRGSPPQVRGKPCCRRTRKRFRLDHPRRCGEN